MRTGMRDQIDFDIARLRHVPMFRANGDLMFEQGAGLGASIQAAFEFEFMRLQAAIDLARTNRQELLFLRRRERKANANPDDPQGQQRFEADRPGIARGFPHRFEHADDFGIIRCTAHGAPLFLFALW